MKKVKWSGPISSEKMWALNTEGKEITMIKQNSFYHQTHTHSHKGHKKINMKVMQKQICKREKKKKQMNTVFIRL